MLLSSHQALLESGLTLMRHMTVAPNTARLAIVVRDASTGTLGSVFVPATKLRKPQ